MEKRQECQRQKSYVLPRPHQSYCATDEGKEKELEIEARGVLLLNQGSKEKCIGDRCGKPKAEWLKGCGEKKRRDKNYHLRAEINRSTLAPREYFSLI